MTCHSKVYIVAVKYEELYSSENVILLDMIILGMFTDPFHT